MTVLAGVLAELARSEYLHGWNDQATTAAYQVNAGYPLDAAASVARSERAVARAVAILEDALVRGRD